VLSVGITKGNPKEAFERGDVVTVEEEFVTNAMSPRRSRRVATSIGEETKIVTLRTRLSGMAETSAGGRMSVDLF
jgi:hypothetical protein